MHQVFFAAGWNHNVACANNLWRNFIQAYDAAPVVVSPLHSLWLDIVLVAFSSEIRLEERAAPRLQNTWQMEELRTDLALASSPHSFAVVTTFGFSYFYCAHYVLLQEPEYPLPVIAPLR